jgi:hypothetical protein
VRLFTLEFGFAELQQLERGLLALELNFAELQQLERRLLMLEFGIFQDSCRQMAAGRGDPRRVVLPNG